MRLTTIFLVLVVATIYAEVACGSIVYVCFPDCVGSTSPNSQIGSGIYHTEYTEQRKLIDMLEELTSTKGSSVTAPVKAFSQLRVINSSDVPTLETFWARIAAEGGVAIVIGSTNKLVPFLIATTHDEIHEYGASTSHLFLIDAYLYSTDYVALSDGEYNSALLRTEVVLWQHDVGERTQTLDGNHSHGNRVIESDEHGRVPVPYLNVGHLALSESILGDMLAVGLSTLSSTSRMLALLEGGVGDDSVFRAALLVAKQEVCEACELIIHTISDFDVIPFLLDHYRQGTVDVQMVDSILVSGDRALLEVLGSLAALNETRMRVIHMGVPLEVANSSVVIPGQSLLVGEAWVNTSGMLREMLLLSLFPSSINADQIDTSTGAVARFTTTFGFQWSLFQSTGLMLIVTPCGNGTSWGGVNCTDNTVQYVMDLYFLQHQIEESALAVNPQVQYKLPNVTSGVAMTRTGVTSLSIDGESKFSSGAFMIPMTHPEAPIDHELEGYIHQRNVAVSIYASKAQAVDIWNLKTYSPRRFLVFSPQSVSPLASLDLVSRGTEKLWLECNETIPTGGAIMGDNLGGLYIFQGVVLGQAVSTTLVIIEGQYPKFACQKLSPLPNSPPRRQGHTATLVMRHDPTIMNSSWILSTPLLRSFVLLGGMCDGGYCKTAFLYTIGGNSPQWNEVILTEEDGSPFQGRSNHRSVLWQNQPMTIGTVTSEDWIVMVGGSQSLNDTRLSIVFVPLDAMFPHSTPTSITTLPVPTTRVVAPNLGTFTSSCVMVADGKLVISGGVYVSDLSERTTSIIWDSRTQQWSEVVSLSGWRGGEVQCAPVGTVHVHGDPIWLTAMLRPLPSESVTPLNTVSMLVTAFKDCKADGFVPFTTGIITAPGGQECIACPSKFYALDDGLNCRPCTDLDPVPRDNHPICAGYNDAAVYTGFFAMLCIQLVALPVMWLCATMTSRAAKMEENEQATIEMSEAVAEMLFERVAYLDQVEHPSKLQKALLRCVNTFKAYRTYIPLSVLTIVDNVVLNRKFEFEEESDDDIDVEMMTPSTALRRGSTSSFSTNLSLSQNQAKLVSAINGRWKSLQDKGTAGQARLRSESPHNSSTQPKRRTHEVGSVSQQVLRALSNNLTERPVSVVATNVVGFHAWCDDQPSDAALVRHHRRFIDAVLQAALLSGGSPDMVMGDKMLLSWNTAQQSTDHLRHAVAYAFDVSTNPVLKQLKMKICLGISSGLARVGVVGGNEAKHFTVLSSITGEAFALCRLAHRYNADILLEWSSEIQRRISDEYVFRIVGAGNFMRNCSTGSRMRVDGEVPQQSTRLLCELLGPTDHTQWLYERKGAREHIGVFNAVMRSVFVGRADEARSISLDGMPLWYHSVLQQVLSDRYIFPDDVTAM